MSDSTIEAVAAWEAFDSRGRPTVACEIRLSGGACCSVVVPSGASTGAHEARELRDGGTRYAGLGVQRAVANVRGELADAVRGLDALDQRSIDTALRTVDGSNDLSRLGANAVLAVSAAAAVAGAAAAGEPLYRSIAGAQPPLLPLPMVNVLSGGAHAGWGIDVQDFLAVPVGAGNFSQAIEWAWRVRTAAAEIVAARGLVSALVADEGGLGPALPSNREALEILVAAIKASALEPGDDVAIAIDVAATQLLTGDGLYALRLEERYLSADELVAELADWSATYPIVSIEDPLAEDDWAGWSHATATLGNLQLLGDDLFVTDLTRLRTGFEREVANAVLVKPNQTGTISAALDVIEAARAAGYATVLSARSGDTEDSWLADLAVGWRTGQIKVGSTTRSERTAKWNRLLQISAALEANAEFAGRGVLAGS